MVVHLANNESFAGPSPRAVRAAAGALLGAYPEPDAAPLRRALAPEGAVVTAGASEAIQLLVRAFPGEVLVSRGSFPLYARAATAAGLPVRAVPRATDGRVDLDALRAGPDTRLVFVANPDNPTATLARDLPGWLGALPAHVVPVVDEAYAGFDPLPALDGAHPNLVRLRSFSKAHGLAGLRVGAALAAPSLARRLDAVRDPFNVSAPAQAAALASLEDRAWLGHVRRANAAARAALVEGLTARGLRTVGEAANFVYLPRVPGLADALATHGVIVRALDAWGHPDAIRITVGDDAQRDRLFAALDGIALRSAS